MLVCKLFRDANRNNVDLIQELLDVSVVNIHTFPFFSVFRLYPEERTKSLIYRFQNKGLRASSTYCSYQPHSFLLYNIWVLQSQGSQFCSSSMENEERSRKPSISASILFLCPLLCLPTLRGTPSP